MLLPVLSTLFFPDPAQSKGERHPNLLTSCTSLAAILKTKKTQTLGESGDEVASQLCNQAGHQAGNQPGTKFTMALSKLNCLVARENLHQVGTLIFLHGEKFTAETMRKYLKSMVHREFEFDHVRVIYPQAPNIPYRVPLGGTQTGMWYEQISYSPTAGERKDSISYTCSLIRQLVNLEKSRGIGHDKIIIGGFDMGGTIAMHVAYR